MADLLRAEGLVTHLFTERGVVRAVDGVSIIVGKGESVALVGESGCGKSMTALSLMRLVRPPGRTIAGKIAFAGRNLLEIEEREMRRLRGGDIAMIFQDPLTYLNPVMRVGEQIVEAIRIHTNDDREAAGKRAREALRQVRIPDIERVFAAYPHQLSGGMRQRALIASAISSRPSLLIADEPTTALDVTVQAQIMELLAAIRRELGSAMLLITHDLGLVAEFCDRVYVMYAGQIVEEGATATLFRAPKHPYTQALLRSVLTFDRKVDRFTTIEGQPPQLIDPPSGCRFHPRCDQVLEKCRTQPPPLVGTEQRGQSRCWLSQ